MEFSVYKNKHAKQDLDEKLAVGIITQCMLLQRMLRGLIKHFSTRQTKKILEGSHLPMRR